MEDVDHDVAEVEQHPAAVGHAVGGVGLHAMVLTHPVADFIAYRAKMGKRSAFANHEKVSDHGDAAHIEDHDVLRLLVVGISRGCAREWFAFKDAGRRNRYSFARFFRCCLLDGGLAVGCSGGSGGGLLFRRHEPPWITPPSPDCHGIFGGGRRVLPGIPENACYAAASRP